MSDEHNLRPETEAQPQTLQQQAAAEAEEEAAVSAPEPVTPGSQAAQAEPEAAEGSIPLSSETESAAMPPESEATSSQPVEPIHREAVIARRNQNREMAEAAVLASSRRYTRRSFAVAAAAAAAGFGFYKWLDGQPGDEMQPRPLREAYRFNAALSTDIHHDQVLAPTYPLDKAETLRVNGTYGLKMELVPESWRLQFVGVKDDQLRPEYVHDVTSWEYRYQAATTKEDEGHDTKVDPGTLTARKMAPEEMLDKAEQDENQTGRRPRGFEEAGESDSTLAPGTPGLLLTMENLLKFPRHELVTQFKCIEGWSQIVHWAGVRLADVIEAYPPGPIDGREPKFVYMETPDGDYYTGYDLNVCRHPQSLLVTEMMGAPLSQFHGAPLRLHMPTKYGYKQIKRIGLISYTNDRPDDYWTKLGYDWYAGL